MALQIPDANKLNPIGNAVDEVLWEDLPVPNHWVTYQLGTGASNEYDSEYDAAALTFVPGRFYVIVSAEGFDPRLFVIDAREPTPDELPVFEDPDEPEEPPVEE